MGDKWQKAKVSKFVVGENGLEIKGEYCPEPQCGPGIFSPCTATASPAAVVATPSRTTNDHASKALHVPSLSMISTSCPTQ